MVIEPGWYEAEGDPPGTQRYWDGQVWVGHPVYEPTPMPAQPPVMVPPPQPLVAVPPPPAGYGYAPVPNVSTFPAAVKALAIILSVLKAIPLAFMAIALLWLIAATRAIDDEFDDFEGFDDFNLDGLLDSASVVLGGILVIGFLLLLFQFIGAIREKPLMVFIPALIMALIDGGFAVLAWIGFVSAQSSEFRSSGPLTSTLLFSAVAGAQVYVAANALRKKTS